jgi:lipopolysaccharide export system protein LptA
MHATGQPALYIADMLQAQALKIEFNQAENNLHLLESAKIINKQSSIQGKHLIIDLNENLLIATSSPTKNKIILDLEANK